MNRIVVISFWVCLLIAWAKTAGHLSGAGASTIAGFVIAYAVAEYVRQDIQRRAAKEQRRIREAQERQRVLDEREREQQRAEEVEDAWRAYETRERQRRVEDARRAWQDPPYAEPTIDAKARKKIADLEALARSTTSDGERQAAKNAAALLREKHAVPAPPPAPVPIRPTGRPAATDDWCSFGGQPRRKRAHDLEQAQVALAASLAELTATLTAAALRAQQRKRRR